MSIILNKQEARINLVKQIAQTKNIGDQKAQIIFCVDISGSMSGLFSDGTMQETFERMLPVAMQFDDNQAIDVLLFDNNVYNHGTLTNKNIENYASNILNKYRFGGTSYAPAIQNITNTYKNAGKNAKQGGFLGFGKKEIYTAPAYVLFLTDGEPSDKSATEQALKYASQYGIFFQFVGIGNSTFNFLQRLDDLKDRNIDNADFFHVNDLNQISDKELYERMLNEFPDWLKNAKQLKIIK